MFLPLRLSQLNRIGPRALLRPFATSSPSSSSSTQHPVVTLPLPSLGDVSSSGTPDPTIIHSWSVDAGDFVKRGEVLAAVEVLSTPLDLDDEGGGSNIIFDWSAPYDLRVVSLCVRGVYASAEKGGGRDGAWRDRVDAEKQREGKGVIEVVEIREGEEEAET
mmetsp:Transcript_31382/g.62215  ORF Transcript_31382/g.62215 Transcript_31382/m.62215 type:complete len:162 (-) Transcript_31382:33-518(-)